MSRLMKYEIWSMDKRIHHFLVHIEGEKLERVEEEWDEEKEIFSHYRVFDYSGLEFLGEYMLHLIQGHFNISSLMRQIRHYKVVNKSYNVFLRFCLMSMKCYLS